MSGRPNPNHTFVQLEERMYVRGIAYLRNFTQSTAFLTEVDDYSTATLFWSAIQL